MYENKNRSSSFAIFLSHNSYKKSTKEMKSWFVVSRLMNHDNEWPEKEMRLIWSYFLFYLFLLLFLFCRINSGKNGKKIELLASTAVMDECESYETLKTNRNFIFFCIYLRFWLVCYFLSRQNEHTDAHLLFMRQTYLRSFHFFAFKFQQRKNVANSVCTVVSFLLFQIPIPLFYLE